MKIIEVTQGLLLPLTNEEADLLLKFRDGNSVSRKDLTERQIEIANHLVVKDVLLRINQDGRINYSKKAP
jgi:hypothetical protein